MTVSDGVSPSPKGEGACELHALRIQRNSYETDVVALF